MDYRNFTSEEMAGVQELYREANWLAYLSDEEKLTRAFEKSLWILGVFNKGKLIGFVRCVGDGEHILLVQDLIVAKAYQGQGIGKKLFQAAWNTFKDVRMFQVNTDLEDVIDNRFYQSFGMRTLEEGHMISYFRG